MLFLVVLAVATVACFALQKPLRKFPAVFYLGAIVLDTLYLMGAFVGLPHGIRSVLMLLMQQCTLSLALFVVVMFVGVFRTDSFVGRWLRPIRSELSVLACLLAVGHMVLYLATFTPRFNAGHAVNDNVAVSFGVALALLVLLLVLGVTSFAFVKRCMRSESWKRLQRFSYLFFGLIYVHLVLMLAPSALRGGAASQESMVVYSVVFVGYGVLRVVRALCDRKVSASSKADMSAAEEFEPLGA